MTSASPFSRQMTVQTAGDRNVRILYTCTHCAGLVDSDGRERHLSWHRWQVGELAPPALESRVTDLLRTVFTLIEAYDAGALPGLRSMYMADLIDAAGAFSVDEAQP